MFEHHRGEQNSKRANRKIMSRVIATLQSLDLSFDRYWSYCTLDAVTKMNSTLHITIDDTPKRVLEIFRSPYSPFPVMSIYLIKFRVFAEYGHVSILQSFNKEHHAGYWFGTSAHPTRIFTKWLIRQMTGSSHVDEPILDHKIPIWSNPFIRPIQNLSEEYKTRVNQHYMIPYTANSAVIEQNKHTHCAQPDKECHFEATKITPTAQITLVKYATDPL